MSKSNVTVKSGSEMSSTKIMKLQDSDDENQGGGSGDPTVTSQPKPSSNTSNAPIALGPPSESSALNLQQQTTYTPGSACSLQF